MYPLHKGERSNSADHGYRVGVAAFAYKCTQWIRICRWPRLLSFTICFSSYIYHIDVSYRPSPWRNHFTVQNEWFMSKRLNPDLQDNDGSWTMLVPLLVLELDVSFVRMCGERIEDCHGLVAKSLLRDVVSENVGSHLGFVALQGKKFCFPVLHTELEAKVGTFPPL